MGTKLKIDIHKYLIDCSSFEIPTKQIYLELRGTCQTSRIIRIVTFGHPSGIFKGHLFFILYIIYSFYLGQRDPDRLQKLLEPFRFWWPWESSLLCYAFYVSFQNYFYFEILFVLFPLFTMYSLPEIVLTFFL